MKKLKEPQHYSFSRDGLTYYGRYPTVEEAIKATLDDMEKAVLADEEVVEGSKFYIGKCVPPSSPESYWEASDWLEHVSCQDEYSCSESADSWDTSTREQREELEAVVRRAMSNWLDAYDLRPTFYTVYDHAEYIFKDGSYIKVVPFDGDKI